MPPSGSTSSPPHTFPEPPPPHVVPAGQLPVPQGTRPPQPSPTAPQFIPTGHAVSGTHAALPPQTLPVPPPPQVSGAVHVPQSMVLPQPSPCVPQLTARVAHVAGTHAAVPPQTLGVPPPPHVEGAVHGPHWITLPQPSPMGPQVAPARAHVRGVQVDASEGMVASLRRTGTVASSGPTPPSLVSTNADPPTPALPHPVSTKTPAATAPQSQRELLLTTASVHGARNAAMATMAGYAFGTRGGRKRVCVHARTSPLSALDARGPAS